MKPIWTLEQVVAQLTNWNARWNNSAPIPYAFYQQPAAHLGQPPNFSSFSTVQRQALERAMQLVSDVCNLSFVNVPDNGQAPSAANSRIGFFNINSASTPFWGAADNYATESQQPPMGRIYGVDVVVNFHRAGVQGGWSIGESNPRKLMHELLHTLGLDHPGAYNGDGNTYEANAEFEQDTVQYTVMSYWLAADTGADHVAGGMLRHASTPLLFDVAALQELYGANMATRVGDTVYGFNSTADRAVFDLAAYPNSVFTIWDAGGRDTLDLSGYSTGSRIDLHAGAFSDTGELTRNISIAHGVTIEDAIGGAGNDVISGNAAMNRLVGGGGGDTFVFAALGESRVLSSHSEGGKVRPDILADFVSGVDRIDLSAIDAIAGTAANDAFSFIGANAFGGHAGELRVQVVGGVAHLMGDVDGDGFADLHIQTAAPQILLSDLVV